jgi:hypothetical protein
MRKEAALEGAIGNAVKYAVKKARLERKRMRITE